MLRFEVHQKDQVMFGFQLFYQWSMLTKWHAPVLSMSIWFYGIMWLHKFALVLPVSWIVGQLVRHLSGDVGCYGNACRNQSCLCLKLL